MSVALYIIIGIVIIGILMFLIKLFSYWGIISFENFVSLPIIALNQFYSIWKLIIVEVILIGVLVLFAVLPSKNFKEPVMLPVMKEATLTSHMSKAPLVTKLHKGDTVKCYGYILDDGLELLVENSAGTRGYVKSHDLGLPMVRMYYPKDTFSIKEEPKIKRQENGQKYKYVLKNTAGEEFFTEHLKCYLPVLPEGENLSALNKNDYYCMSWVKFKHLYEGKSISQIDSIVRPPMFLTKKEAVFRHIRIIDTTTCATYCPTVFFNDSLKVSGFGWRDSTACMLLKYLRHVPGYMKILDSDFFASLIQGSLYAYPLSYMGDYAGSLCLDDSSETAIFLLKIISSTLGCVLVYLFLFMACCISILLPVALMMTLANWRFSFYFLNNQWLSRLFILVLGLTTCVWIVEFSIWMPISVAICVVGALIILLAVILGGKISEIFNEEFFRCTSCKRLRTMEEGNVEFVQEWQSWEMESKRKTIDSDTQHYDTWTEVSIKNIYGETLRKHEENREHHTITTTVYKDTYYNVLYHYKEYRRKYTCSECGGVEYEYFTKRKELKRNYSHSSLDSTTSST